ncbi:MAG: GDSL-type esterase/lipase family protein [Bacteroidales bacterium]
MKKHLTTILIICFITCLPIQNLTAQQPDWVSTYWPHEEGIKYDEPYRGQFHYSIMSGYTSDVDLLVYKDGLYHMTYIAGHPSMEIEVSQGYATSPDLLNWTDRGMALIPNGHSHSNIDALMVYSGSGIIISDSIAFNITGSTDSAIVAIFTGVTVGTCLAWTNDNGKSWHEYDGNPVAHFPVVEDETRDPCVIWHEPSNKWVLVIFENNETFSFYGSTDLINWNYLSNAGFGHECPDFFQLPLDGDPSQLKWVLHDARGMYVIGTFDGTTFTEEEGPYITENGPGFYASQSFHRDNLPGGKVIQMGWLQWHDYGVQTHPWDGAITFPVEIDLVTYNGEMRIARNPIQQISSIYKDTIIWDELLITPDSNLLEGIYSKKMDITAEFDLTNATASEIQFQIANKTITYNINDETLISAPEHPMLDILINDGIPKTRLLNKLSNNHVKIRILADWGQLEIFGNDGIFSYTEKFDFSPCDSTLALTTVGGNVKLVSMEFHEVARTWKGTPQPGKMYDVNTNTVGSGSVITDAHCDSYTEGMLLELTAIPDAGYHFDSWEGDATGKSNPLSIIVDGNKSITAVFRENKFPTNPKIMPLGASRVEGARPVYESFRYELWKNLIENGWSFDYIGTMTDPAAYTNYSGQVFDKHHEGHGGYTSGQILANLDEWMSSAGIPDIVLFSSPGGNDALEGLPVDEAISNINGIIDVLQAVNPDVTIFIEQLAPGHSDIMTTGLTAYIEELQSEVLTIATQQTTYTSNVIAIDMFTGWSNAYLADDVHYNATGAKVIADRYDAAMEAFYPGGSTSPVKKKDSPAISLIYPNPVKNELQIVCDEIIESYEVYNQTGCVMKRGKGNRIDVSELCPGLYLIVLNGEFREKFVKY